MEQRGFVSIFFVWLIFLAVEIILVQGHGRLVQPPSRSSAWRYGFNTEKDFNDNEAYCGGWSRQHQKNHGKCGVCGDPWDSPQPRLHEHGGRYGQGVIVATYRMDSDIEIGAELTANHFGFFEYRLCEHNFQKSPETDDCFNKHLLNRTDQQGSRYYPGPGTGVVFKSTYKLPQGLTCDQCVLQWRYVAGNNWGLCPNGSGTVGCGPQEQFRGCADISITIDGVSETSTSSSTTPTTSPPSRTRGTVTSRVRRPTTTTTATTNVTSTSTTSTDTTTESSANNYVNPGPYAGIIIALATLLFAIVFIMAIILYFYRFHADFKSFIRKHLRKSEVNPGFQKALKLPASVFTNHYAPQLETKPPVPVRIRDNNNGILRQLSVSGNFISEPLDVTINGVSVDREDHSIKTQNESSS